MNVTIEYKRLSPRKESKLHSPLTRFSTIAFLLYCYGCMLNCNALVVELPSTDDFTIQINQQQFILDSEFDELSVAGSISSPYVESYIANKRNVAVAVEEGSVSPLILDSPANDFVDFILDLTFDTLSSLGLSESFSGDKMVVAGRFISTDINFNDSDFQVAAYHQREGSLSNIRRGSTLALDSEFADGFLEIANDFQISGIDRNELTPKAFLNHEIQNTASLILESLELGKTTFNMAGYEFQSEPDISHEIDIQQISNHRLIAYQVIDTDKSQISSLDTSDIIEMFPAWQGFKLMVGLQNRIGIVDWLLPAGFLWLAQARIEGAQLDDSVEVIQGWSPEVAANHIPNRRSFAVSQVSQKLTGNELAIFDETELGSVKIVHLIQSQINDSSDFQNGNTLLSVNFAVVHLFLREFVGAQF